MTDSEQKIIDIKVKYEDAINGIVKFRERINELNKDQKKLDELLQNDMISWEEWAKQTEAASAATKQLKENQRILRKEIQNNLRTEQEQQGSLKQLRAQLSNATKAYDELSRAERNGAKGNELRNHIVAITNELKAAEEETQRFYRNVGNYYNSMFNALQDLGGLNFGGNIGNAVKMCMQLGQAAEGAGTKVKGFVNAIAALAKNPVFLTIAGIVGVGTAAKWWWDYNTGLAEATRLTREFTRLSGSELTAVRNGILETASAMGAEFKETLSTVDFLMAQFGLDAQAALKVVQDGFTAGANLSGDMLSKMQRYAPAFKDMGLTAEELAAVLAQTRSGIFTDQGMDAIVMAGKKLREMSDTTAKALDAVGIDSKQLAKDMATGAITGFEAIQQVSEALAKTGTNSKQAGQVMKEVFGRQAVAAGQELLKSLATMSTSIEEVKEQTGEWGKQQQQLIDAQTELSNVTSALFDMSDKGFEEMINQAKIYATQSLTQVAQWLVKIINYFVELYNKSTLFRGTMELLVGVFKTLWEVCKVVFGLIENSFKGIGRDARAFLKIMEGILTFDFSKAKEGFADLINGWGKTFDSQVDTFRRFGSNVWGAIKDGWNKSVNGNELKPIEIPILQPSATQTQGGGTTAQTTTDGSIGGKTDGKKTTKATATTNREDEERKRKEKELQEKILRVQMEYNDKMMQAKKMLLAGLYQNQEEYENDMSQLQQEEIARMLDVYVEAGAIGQEKALEMQGKLLDLQIQFKAQLEKQAATLAQEWRNEFDKLEREREESMLNQGILEKQDNAARLERFKAFLEAKKQAYKDNAAALAEIDKEEKEIEEQQEKEQYEEKKKLLEMNKDTAMDIAGQITNGFANAFAQMFSEQEVNFRAFMRSILTTTLDAIEKELLIYEANILAHEMANKSWAGIASAAALSALIAAAFEGAKAAVKSFAVGGYVSGAGTGTSDSIPARLSNGESVMTAKATSMFSPLLSAFNQLGGGVPIQVHSQTGSQIGEDFLAAAIAKGFMMCPRPVVSVEEITKLQDRVKVIEGRGIS